jgi:hypothetical protein
MTGFKDDKTKAPVWEGVICNFPLALERIAHHSAHNRNAREWQDWQQVPGGFARYSNALSRHLLEETTVFAGLPEIGHATAVAWNALARLEILLRGRVES